MRQYVRLTGMEKSGVLTPMATLDAMIRQGYGDVPQWQLPADWRTVKREDQKDLVVHHVIGIPEEMLPRRGKR